MERQQAFGRIVYVLTPEEAYTAVTKGVGSEGMIQAEKNPNLTHTVSFPRTQLGVSKATEFQQDLFSIGIDTYTKVRKFKGTDILNKVT